MHMVGFRDATFFTALAMNASTVLSLALFIAFFLLIISRSPAPRTVIIGYAQYISALFNIS